jgi:hypothetical protein
MGLGALRVAPESVRLLISQLPAPCWGVGPETVPSAAWTQRRSNPCGPPRTHDRYRHPRQIGSPSRARGVLADTHSLFLKTHNYHLDRRSRRRSGSRADVRRPRRRSRGRGAHRVHRGCRGRRPVDRRLADTASPGPREDRMDAALNARLSSRRCLAAISVSVSVRNTRRFDDDCSDASRGSSNTKTTGRSGWLARARSRAPSDSGCEPGG